MPAQLIMKLESSGALNHRMSSLFHGVLMELIPEEYAEILHQSRLHPYSQYLKMQNKEWYWIVNALNQEAEDIILHQTLENLSDFYLKKNEITVQVKTKEFQKKTLSEMMQQFYKEDADKFVSLQFLTPTAFKQQGQYIFYPDIRCIYQSLMNKYDASVEENVMMDVDTLDQLCQDTRLVKYDLRSVRFDLEGIRVPAFLGSLTLRLTGTQTMANFANMLFEFGTYSGIGIKTGLGMGAYELVKEGRTK